MADNDRLGKDAWLEAALSALRERGLPGVAVEPLARSLGVTKGSFYWHFTNRDALLQAAMEQWESLQTEGLIEAVSSICEPRARLVELIERAHRSPRGLRLTRALAAAAEHPIIGPALRRVTERRLSYLAQCFAALGLDARAAKHAARVGYAAYLGLAELDALGLGLTSKSEQRAYLDQLLVNLLPGLPTPALKGKGQTTPRAG